MRVLLDTHVLIWSVGVSHVLPRALRRALEDPINSVHYSVVSLFEIAQKRSKGDRRSAPDVTPQRLRELATLAEFSELPVLASHAMAVEALAVSHPDPFDRLLLAQAHVEGLQLVTHDERLAAFDDRTILF